MKANFGNETIFTRLPPWWCLRLDPASKKWLMVHTILALQYGRVPSIVPVARYNADEIAWRRWDIQYMQYAE